MEKIIGEKEKTILLSGFSHNAQPLQSISFNDTVTGGGDQVAKARLLQTNDNDAVALPDGFYMRSDGLYYCDPDDQHEEWVCSPIEVLANTRDEHHTNWGKLVRLKDPGGCVHTFPISMSLITGYGSRVCSLLVSNGLSMSTKRSIRNKLPEYLQNIKPTVTALCTSRIGWHGDHFLLPGGATPPTDKLYLQTDNYSFAEFKVSGTVEEWRENIAKPCHGNSRLIFAICSAFAPPLLSFLNIESGGFNLKGASSIGKSTALHIAASVWGSPKYTQQWKATSNALEAVAEAHNNALLCLDELGQIDSREAAEIAYMLANGSGKNRLSGRRGLRNKFEWQLLCLSTGETSISDKVYAAGEKLYAGIPTRIADIPADPGKGYGIFDTVHDFGNGNRLVHHLKKQIARYYGAPIREYLHKLTLGKERLAEVDERARQDFFARYVKDDVDGQVTRVATRFAILVTAGYLAIDYDILPYTRQEVLEAIGACFQAWLEERGTTGAYEMKDAVNQVRDFVRTHDSRFALIGPSNETSENAGSLTHGKIPNLAGFKRKVPDGGYEIFVLAEVFRQEVCHGLNPKLICHELWKLGMLKRVSDSKFTKDQRLPIGREKVYHLLPTVLTEQGGSDGIEVSE